MGKALEPIGRIHWPIWPLEMERSTQPATGRVRSLQPPLKDQAAPSCIHKYIAVIVIWLSCLHSDLLVPTMHTAGGIGLHREGHVLIHANLLPMDLSHVGVPSFKGCRQFCLTEEEA